ncbi:MAG: hypothetical protein QOH70_984 [Blastocatellia bacterium]|jgi:hypothetical protein|nr:hypothetical protein [Blastocatellia bacterium]
MNRRTPPILLGVLFLCATVTAQPNEANKPAPAMEIAGKGKAAADLEAERILRERRAQAQSLLISLAADAGSYSDQKLRARTQARIADALWDADQDRARTLFRRAWDAAEIVDQGDQRPVSIDMTRPNKGGSIPNTGPTNVRSEVLRLAARRDRALGEEMLAKLKVEKAREATEAADKTKGDLFNTPDGVSQRLNLASQLLATDVERALQFADPALVTITREGIDFLSYLREKNAAAADRRYAGSLAMAAGNLQSDANTVSLLSSYLFTPHVFVTFTDSGANTQSSRNSEAPLVAAELRTAFFRVAVGILLRPQAPPGQDQTSSGLQGKYLMIKRLLPLFEQFAPRDMTEALRAQMEALGTAVPEDLRQRDDNSLREGIRPSLTSDDREKALLDRIDRAKTSEDRDGLYVQLARIRADNGDLRARDYVDKIDDSELRQNTRAYTDITMTMRAVDKKNAEQILEFVRTGELTHLQKAWALASAAKLLAKTDREKALAVIEDAAAEARRIEGSDPDRPRALMAVANALLINDRSKTWDATYDAVRAANSAEGFTGEDGVLRISFFTKVIASVHSSSAQDFDVSGIFGELAKEDYNRTVELARGFEREAPRASAVIAIAKAVLENKDKPKN